MSHAPAEEAFKTKNKVEPLGKGVDTHTHTVPLRGARAKNLNSYRKSLRNKRQKHRKSSAKRAKEKGVETKHAQKATYVQMTLLWDTLVGHSCRKLFWDTLL